MFRSQIAQTSHAKYAKDTKYCINICRYKTEQPLYKIILHTYLAKAKTSNKRAACLDILNRNSQ